MSENKIKKMMGLKYSERDAIIFVRANGKCEYCDTDLIGERLAFDTVQFDHIIPKSKGGGDSEENIAFCCQVCNTAKHTHTPEGSNREERIAYTRDYLKNKRSNANEFWLKVKAIFEAS